MQSVYASFGKLIAGACAVLLFGMAVTVVAAELLDTPENRNAAVERYLTAVPPENLVADSIQQVSLQVPEPRREEFIRMMQELVRPAEIRRISREVMVKHFTAQELDALAKFFSSPEG